MTGVDTLKALFDDKKIRVLQLFIQKPQDQFTLQETVKRSKVPLSTAHRILKVLTANGILRRKKVKHLILYNLGTSAAASYLTDLLYERPKPLTELTNKLAHVAGILQIIMHGEATDTRANIVIIGSDLDKSTINSVVANIHSAMNFTISHLILDEDQFNMLESMGQFSGTKTTLFQQ